MSDLQVLNSPQQAAQVDEWGELSRQLAATAPAAKRHKELSDIIRLRYQNHPAGETAVAEGTIYRVLISERAEERKLPLKARLRIFALLGKVRALELFTITLKAVEESPEIKPEVLEMLVTRERTGYRTLKAVSIAPAQRAA